MAGGLRVRVLPALSDNYMYLLVCGNTNQAAVVDPVDPDSMLAVTRSCSRGCPASQWWAGTSG